MIEINNAFPTTPIDKKDARSSFPGKEVQFLFKFKDRSNVRYIIEVDKFENNVHFIKFYRQRHEGHGVKKFQWRSRKVFSKEFSRIIATCAKVALDIRAKDETAIFAFVGQWDNKDVKNQNKESQRSRIYKRALSSLVNEHNYKFISREGINYIGLVPKATYQEGMEEVLFSQFFNWIGEDGLVDLLEVPSCEE